MAASVLDILLQKASPVSADDVIGKRDRGLCNVEAQVLFSFRCCAAGKSVCKVHAAALCPSRQGKSLGMEVFAAACFS